MHTPPAHGADNVTEIKGLKTEVEALKSKCDLLESTVQILKSGYDTHENIIDNHRKQILGFQKVRGTLDTSYQGENLELKQ